MSEPSGEQERPREMLETALQKRKRGRPKKPVEDKFLKFLNGVAGASGFMDIVARSGLPKSTVWRYLHGYSEMITITNGKYSLTESGLSTFRSLYGKELTRKMQEHLMSSISVEDVMQYRILEVKAGHSESWPSERLTVVRCPTRTPP